MIILIVEDDPDSALLLSSILEKNKYTPMIARSVPEAVNLLQSNSRIELIICDIRMPEQDGFDFLKFLNDNLRFRHLPVIMSTVLNDEDTVKKTIRMGARDFIVKPIEEEMLIEKVERVMDAGLGTVLIVVEDKITLGLLEGIIQREKYKTLTTDNGERALEIIAETRVDLVVSDIDLPVMSGLDLLVDIKGTAPGLPVVLIASESGKFKPLQVIEAGADGSIVKPFLNTQIGRTLMNLGLGARKL